MGILGLTKRLLVPVLIKTTLSREEDLHGEVETSRSTKPSDYIVTQTMIVRVIIYLPPRWPIMIITSFTVHFILPTIPITF